MATLAIVLVEGRGIWLELAGGLVAGRSTQVAQRLRQLAALHFQVVVLDCRRLSRIDPAGTAILEAFLKTLDATSGHLYAVIDPSAAVPAFTPIAAGAVHIAHQPPIGAWWTDAIDR